MKKRRRRRNGKGIITVFVTLIMVPVVVCTGTIVDVARLKLYSSQAAMAADSYAETVLGEYDNLLKDLYGLFSVTQNSEGIEAINTLAEYTKYSFDPSGGDLDVEGFMPYKSATVGVSHVPVDGATLNNNNVLMTQVGDFMKYRIIEELLDSTGILSTFEGFTGMSADMEAVNTRNEITKSCSDILETIDDYYQTLKEIDDYSNPDYEVLKVTEKDGVKTETKVVINSDSNGYLQERVKKFETYSAAMHGIVRSDDYEKYNYYMKPENKSRIDEAKVAMDEYAVQKALYDMEYRDYQEDYEDYEDDLEQYEKDLEQYQKDLADYNAGKIATAPTPPVEPVEPTAPVPPEEPSQATKDLAAKYVDADEYVAQLAYAFAPYSEDELNSTNKAIQFLEFGSKGNIFFKFGKLNKYATTITEKLTTLDQQISELEAQLPACTESARKGIKEEIADLKDLTSIAEDFQGTVDAMESHNNTQKDDDNVKKWDDGIDALKEVELNIYNGTQEIDECSWATTITFEWYDFKTDRQAFYDRLQSMCESSGAVAGQKANEKAGEEEQKKADAKTEEYKGKIDSDPGRATTWNFTTELANQMKQVPSAGEVPDLADCFSDGATLADIGNAAVGKFLLTSYDMNMFSSRVSGVEPPDEEDSETDVDVTPVASPAPAAGGDADTDEEEEYYDESLTGIKMSTDVNYLYGAEVEYLIAGYTGDNSTKKNQDYTRNVICGVRMATNFVSTYSISEVNTAISTIANTAATAVSAVPYIGPVLGPIVRVAVSGALRLAVATIETSFDWEMLLKREKVIFYKSSLDELSCLAMGKNAVGDLLGITETTGEKGDSKKNGVSLDFELSYEDYLYIMMLFFVDEDTLSKRTSNLITLNVNQAQNTSGSALTTLDFLMSDTVTAIKSTVELELDFVIVPENFLNLFISGSDAEAVIQKLNDGGYGYSIIRGY